jgi:hypothetical protein
MTSGLEMTEGHTGHEASNYVGHAYQIGHVGALTAVAFRCSQSLLDE